MWNNQELEIYLKYERLTNLYFEPIWCNIEADRLQELIDDAKKELLLINKHIRVYKDFEYLDTVQLSTLNFIKEIHPDNLITWIPINFKNRKELGAWIRKQVFNAKLLN